jgi:UDP-N-acetylglucosamine 2-epimerase
MVLSDSGTIGRNLQKWGFLLWEGIRTSTGEDQRAIDAGTIVLGGVSTDSMLNTDTQDLEGVKPHNYTWYLVTNTSERVIKKLIKLSNSEDKVIWDK